MGLFTTRCTNHACQRRIRRGAEFCGTCGTPAPTRKSVCQQCKAEVRATTRFCPKCGADVQAQQPPLVLAGKWARPEGDFAVRVDETDVKDCLKPLFVDAGTEALLIQDGKFCGRLGPGTYNLNTFTKRLLKFNLDRRATVILADAGDITIDLENGNLFSADPLEVGVSQRLVLRISNPDALYTNLMKGSVRVTVDDIERQIAGEVQAVLAGIVSQYPAEQLFKQLEVRDAIEQALRDALATTLAHLGVELVQLRFLSFTGRAYEEVRSANADVAERQGKTLAAQDRLKVRQQLRDSLTAEKMHELDSEKKLEAYVRQTEHELGLKDTLRADEIGRLSERLSAERSHEALVRELDAQTTREEHERTSAWDALVAAEDRTDESAKRTRERKLADYEADAKIADQQLDRMRKVKQMEHEDDHHEADLEAKLLKQRGEATAAALLTIVDGPEATRLVELEKLRQQQSMSPEQMLAMAAAASPAAAQALAAKYAGDKSVSDEKLALLQQQLQAQQQADDKHADRMEKLMQTAMEQMGAVAGKKVETPPPGPTIVPGAGGPTIINPPKD